MAAGDLISADWQMEAKATLIGEGSAFAIVQVEGLADIPDVRTGDMTRLRRHGESPGDDFLSGRTVVLTVEIEADTDTAFNAAVSALSAATRPGLAEDAIFFRIPGVAGGARRYFYGRARRRSLPVALDFYYRIPTAVIEFRATDPRLYGDAITLQTSLPAIIGGWQFPEVPPITFGSSGTTGNISTVVDGTFSTPPVFRIDGPITSPSIFHVQSGKTLALNLTLASGEFLIIDADDRTVLLGGTASRYSSLTSPQFFDLEPGQNDLQFRAAVTSAATLSLTYRPAWV